MDHATIVVQGFMSPAPQTISREITLSQASHLMRELDIRHLPVMEGGKIIGIVSDRDVCLLGSVKGINIEKILVDDVMSRDLYVVSPDTPLDDALRMMIDQKIGSAVVMDRGKLAGIFTVIDALRALSGFLQSRSIPG